MQAWRRNHCFLKNNIIIVVVVVFVCVQLCEGTRVCQKHWIPVDKDLQAVVSLLGWVLGIELYSSEKAVHSLNC